MTCEHVKIPDGGYAIVCGRSQRSQHCKCGRPSTRMCDWKVPSRKSKTCDAPLCDRCTHSPAPDKDLCAEHAAIWFARGQTDQGPAA